MPDFRCYAPELSTDQAEVTLNAFESHHLVTTNRARKGDQVALFNGAGLECQAILKEADRRSAALVPNSFIRAEPPTVKITLAIALTKGKTFETLLRQATELGVTIIQPLLSERTQVQINKDTSKHDKWTQQLIEGCKQSGNPWLPVLKKPVRLREYLSGDRLESAVVASLEEKAKSWRELTLKTSSSLFVGPEGDFSPEEYRLLEEKGAMPVTLGRFVLKSETAVVTAIAQLAVAIQTVEK